MYLEALQEKVCVQKCVSECKCACDSKMWSLSAVYDTLNCFHYLTISLASISPLSNVMLCSLCRVELNSGSCWRQRRRKTQSWSVNKRRRERKLIKRQRHMYGISWWCIWRFPGDIWIMHFNCGISDSYFYSFYLLTDKWGQSLVQWHIHFGNTRGGKSLCRSKWIQSGKWCGTWQERNLDTSP